VSKKNHEHKWAVSHCGSIRYCEIQRCLPGTGELGEEEGRASKKKPKRHKHKLATAISRKFYYCTQCYRQFDLPSKDFMDGMRDAMMWNMALLGLLDSYDDEYDFFGVWRRSLREGV
jgi:hypothetical protein